MKLTIRTWISIATAVLVIVILFLARKELLHALHLLTQVNWWILALIVPVLLFDYYASGEMAFSFLRAKGNMRGLSPTLQVRTSLEMNFVNHVLPSGGVSGISYMTWRMGQLGVPASRALVAQAVKYGMSIVAFLLLLLVAVIAVTIDGSVNRAIILLSSVLAGVMIATVVGCLYVIASPTRIRSASLIISRLVNRVVKTVTFGRRLRMLDHERTEKFMMEMHVDYIELRRDVRVLKWPLVWSIVFTCLEILTFFVVFWALGTIVNPALLLIAYGIAMLAGFAVVTPGGTGAYEAIMVAFLTFAGVSGGAAVAGIVLARVIILLAILVLGWGFYQKALHEGHKK